MIKKILLFIIMAAYLVTSIFAAYVLINKIIDKYSTEDEMISFFKKGEINLLIEDELIKNAPPPIINGSEIFIPFDIVKEYIEPTIYKETDGSVITVISGDKVIRMKDGDLQAYVNMEPVELDMTARYINRELYVPVVVFSDIFEIEASYTKAVIQSLLTT